LFVISGGLSEGLFEVGRKMPSAIEAILKRFDLCLVRTPSDAKRFGDLGAPRLSLVGNLKFDVPQLPVDDSKLAALARSLAARPVMAAASTHAGEERAV